MSQAPLPSPPPEYEDVLPTAAPTNPKPPSHRAQFLFTIVPFAVYALARFIPLPTYRIDYSPLSRDWSDSDNLVAVGIMPWLIAAVIIDIVSWFIRGVQRLLHQDPIGDFELRRVMNIFGLMFAVIHASWIIFDLTYDPGVGMWDPSHPSLPTPRVSSPILAFMALLLGAIGLKWLVDFAVPRSLLDKRGRILAGALLLTTVYTLSRETSHLQRFYFDIPDLIRILINVFKAGMLVAFLFLGPEFLWPNASRTSISNRPTQST